MRDHFHGELAELGSRLERMGVVAGSELRLATKALLEQDMSAADRVLAEDAKLDRARDRTEHEAQVLLALQAPVAKDLRTVLAAVYCADRLERMGDLARHIAELARREYPAAVLPSPLVPTCTTLGRLTASMADDLRRLLAGAEDVDFDRLRSADDQVDDLHERLMGQVTSPEWTHGVRSAINVALVARFYERFADQAVFVARRLDFTRTGAVPA